MPGLRGALLADGLLARTGGNPLYVLETLKQAWVDDSLGALAAEAPAGRDAGALLPRPAAVVRTPGLLLLVPGSLGFRGLTTAVAGDLTQSVQFLFDMLLVGGAAGRTHDECL